MEIFLELIIGFFLELTSQVVIELLAELGIRSIGNAFGFTRLKSPLLTFIGYVILAAILGAVSIRIWGDHFLEDRSSRLIYLAFIPPLIGILMGILGKVLKKNDKRLLRLDSFWYGYAFAFTFGLVRFFFAK